MLQLCWALFLKAFVSTENSPTTACTGKQVLLHTQGTSLQLSAEMGFKIHF